MHGPVEPGEPAQQAGHVGAAQRVADDRDEPAGQQARSSACATAAAALRCPPPVSPMRKSNGRGGCSGLAIAHLRLFCCVSRRPSVRRRERAVDGFPPGEQAMPVVVADDPRRRPSPSAPAGPGRGRAGRGSRRPPPARPGPARKPFSPACTSSASAPASTATTGRPLAIAAMVASDCSSACDAIANTSASRYRPGRSSSGDEAEEAHPVRHAVMAGERAQPALVGARPREDEHRAPCRCSAPRSRLRQPGELNAAMSTSARFSGLSLPTDRMTGRPAGSAYRRPQRLVRRPRGEPVQVDAVRHGLRRRPQPVVAQQPQRGRGRRGDEVAAVREPGDEAVERRVPRPRRGRALARARGRAAGPRRRGPDVERQVVVGVDHRDAAPPRRPPGGEPERQRRVEVHHVGREGGDQLARPPPAAAARAAGPRTRATAASRGSPRPPGRRRRARRPCRWCRAALVLGAMTATACPRSAQSRARAPWSPSARRPPSARTGPSRS